MLIVPLPLVWFGRFKVGSGRGDGGGELLAGLVIIILLLMFIITAGESSSP